jgi:hypothetical protein
MTWSSFLNKKRKRASPTYEFIPRNGVRCIRIRTYLSILYSQRTLKPCITKFKNSNTHVRTISLPPTKRRATRRREMSWSQAVQHSIVDFFVLKKTTGFPLAQKKNSRALPNARSLRASLIKREMRRSNQATANKR